MSYTITTSAVVTPADAKRIGKYLALYAINVAGLHVADVMPDGKRIANNAAAKTIADTASSAAGAGVINLGFGAALGPLLLALINPITGLLIAIPGLLASIRALHWTNERQSTPGATHSEITFTLANVGPQRRRWSEQLLLTYTTPLGWHVAGLQTNARPLRRPPTPWSTGRRPATSHRS